MNVQCRIYKKSGFNETNIPAEPSLFDSLEYVDVPAIDVLQDRYISTLRVKAEYKTIRSADYLRLITGSLTQYFAIKGITMLNTDTAELSIIQDFISTAGGVSKLEFLDGITDRVHVTNDEYGMYTQEDPLCTPSEPLQIQTKFATSLGGESITLLESTLDVGYQGLGSTGSATVYSYTDDDGVTNKCTVPSIKHHEHEELDTCTYAIDDTAAITNNVSTFVYATESEDSEFRDVLKKGIDRCRALGVDECIINQVSIPKGFIDITTTSYIDETISSLPVKYITKLVGKWGETVTELPFTKYSKTDGYKNMRINYGTYNTYGLMTVSGEQATFSPEEIYDTDNMFNDAPYLRWVADPRLDGKPYYRYKSVNGNSGKLNFFQNCVSGLSWKQVPLKFTKASGWEIANTRTYNSLDLLSTNYQYTQDTNKIQNRYNMTSNAISATGNLYGLGVAASQALSLDFSGALQTGISSGIGLANNLATYEYQSGMYNTTKNYQTDTYNLSRRNELADLYINNNIQVPKVSFPMDTQTLRDFYGDGVLLYRYYYSKTDAKRIDKLLTMYGYRFTKFIDATDFTNRKYFNYVKTSSCTVTGFSKYINDGCGAQLNNGVRVWHVLPDNKYYSDNPVEE